MDSSDSEIATMVAGRLLASPSQELVLRYGIIVLLAMLPIYVGSRRSLKIQREWSDAEWKVDTTARMCSKQLSALINHYSLMMPIVASAEIIVMYVLLQVMSRETLNSLLAGTFYIVDVTSMMHFLSPVIDVLSRPVFQNRKLKEFVLSYPEWNKDTVRYELMSYDLLSLTISALFAAWYVAQKHWIASNILAVSFAINGIELVRLNKIATGCILLLSLLCYDIFWVYGSSVLGYNVMEAVTVSLDIPAKLTVPQSFKQTPVSRSSILGLGDVVFPGIFIAHLLRFDDSLRHNSKTFFYTSLLSYFIGLSTAAYVSILYHHCQPALLFLVPTCVGIPMALAYFKGELNTMLEYRDFPTKVD